jgi:hypothetical protein
MEQDEWGPRYEVEKTVNAWRKAKQIPLPDLPPDEITRIRGSLPFPPEDSWLNSLDDSED